MTSSAGMADLKRANSAVSNKSKKSQVSSKTIKGKTTKVTGGIDLDLDLAEASWGGRLVVVSNDDNELGRVDLPLRFRQGCKDPAPWNPVDFKEYLADELGVGVFEVRYRVRDTKKGSAQKCVRWAQLGIDDLNDDWPFVPGMQIQIETSDDAGMRKSLNRSASGTTSSTSASLASCTVM
eukprot:CAMPEP_0197883306 /NCGR_PEP_ID=MMETSP1439-20131203/10179_1 /TAXON_ID=66791 /ORGANISM="Gonyaulax spinifera, Strain CCMP409" /LENGTH=179 /DNA_ID=CAMNT_0043503023 /DNA_START=75 /DNA_END=614 /DNA_ORIENTATION=-